MESIIISVCRNISRFIRVCTKGICFQTEIQNDGPLPGAIRLIAMFEEGETVRGVGEGSNTRSEHKGKNKGCVFR